MSWKNFHYKRSISCWIIDTSATHHRVNTLSLILNHSVQAHSSVRLPDGSLILVIHIRTVDISDCLILPDVLCVLSFLIICYMWANSYMIQIFMSYFFIIIVSFKDLSRWVTIGLVSKKMGVRVEPNVNKVVYLSSI